MSIIASFFYTTYLIVAIQELGSGMATMNIQLKFTTLVVRMVCSLEKMETSTLSWYQNVCGTKLGLLLYLIPVKVELILFPD